MKRILVVEPDPGLSWLICESLRAAGYETDVCPPEQAAERAAALPANAVVAALSSIALEQAPLYRALRGDSRTKDVPLVLITGRGDATVRRRLGEKPPQVLFKPFELDALVLAVAQTLGDA